MKKIVGFLLVILLVASLFGCTNKPQPPLEVPQPNGAMDEQAVGELVENFGKKLQMVSLQASKDILDKSLQEHYAEFVSPALLTEWSNNPLQAPGRLTSSPWPDRIEILSKEKIGDGYVVKGEIIEITSQEQVNGGIAAKRPITLSVKKFNDRWLIESVNLGPYGELGGIVYKNTQYGFQFSLPESWKGYTIVTEEWQGVSPEAKTVETGPKISIRHPAWTAQNPRQDIPILILTLEQWALHKQEKFNIGAAPIGPKELGRNDRYVFALPARYNYAFPIGYEEVEDILESNPLQAN